MRVCVIGHFAFGKDAANGQTIKTKILTKELVRQFGENEVKTIDTHGSGIKSLLKAPFQTFSALKNSQNVIMLPAHNGVRVFGRLLPFFKSFIKNKKIHYVVIGGWLAEFVRKNRGLARSLKKFDGVYVETNTMKRALEAQGFENVIVMPNCKELKILNEDELVYSTQEPYKLCTFSRVMKEKGIGDAVEAVKAVNEMLGHTAFTLDIYGAVDATQTEWFDKLQRSFPEYVHYCGVVDFDKSVETLKNYFALLFPTYYEGEGFAGTLIDAFSAGVPIIASDWKYNAEIVDNKENGLIYSLAEKNGLENALCWAVKNSDAFNEMKCACLQKSQLYSPSKVVKDFIKYF